MVWAGTEARVVVCHMEMGVAGKEGEASKRESWLRGKEKRRRS